MSDDLTSLLRRESGAHFAGNLRDRRTIGALLFKAADEIDRLRAENARMRDALEEIECEEYGVPVTYKGTTLAWLVVYAGCIRAIARAALKGGDDA